MVSGHRTLVRLTPAMNGGTPINEKPRQRVLTVEDDPDVVESFKVLLEMIGNDVHAVGDGLAALAAARLFRPDVVFIDIDLPGMNGYELANHFRKEYGRSVRLYALTGFGQAADRERALSAGFDLHIVKPVDLAFIEKLLGISSPAS